VLSGRFKMLKHTRRPFGNCNLLQWLLLKFIRPKLSGSQSTRCKLRDGRPFSVQVVDQHLHFGTLMPLRVGAFIPLITPDHEVALGAFVILGWSALES
jgi:hypothetical protein